jgi:hypothetical protein
MLFISFMGKQSSFRNNFNIDGFQDIAITAVKPGGENVIYILLGNDFFGQGDIQIDQLLATKQSSCFRIIVPYFCPLPVIRLLEWVILLLEG